MLVHVCPSCVGGRPPHSQGRVSGRFSGINVKAYLVSYDLNTMSLVLMLRLSGFLSQWWFFSDSHLLRPNTQECSGMRVRVSRSNGGCIDILVVKSCGIFLPAISLMSVLLFASENDQLESSNGLLNPTRLVGPRVLQTSLLCMAQGITKDLEYVPVLNLKVLSLWLGCYPLT